MGYVPRHLQDANVEERTLTSSSDREGEVLSMSPPQNSSHQEGSHRAPEAMVTAERGPRAPRREGRGVLVSATHLLEQFIYLRSKRV